MEILEAELLTNSSRRCVSPPQVASVEKKKKSWNENALEMEFRGWVRGKNRWILEGGGKEARDMDEYVVARNIGGMKRRRGNQFLRHIRSFEAYV